MAQIVESTVEFPYQRSLGPVVGRYVAALAAHRILGVRSGGRVLSPPPEYDPDTGADTGELVDVGPAGTVTTWTWVPAPSPRHPLDRPFAFALIRLDGADTAMFHAVDAGEAAAMATGLRVLPRWRAEPRGQVDDLECFVPEGGADRPVTAAATAAEAGGAAGAEAAAGSGGAAGEPAAAGRPAPSDLEPVRTAEFLSSLTYRDTLAPAGRRYATALLAGRLLGQRCPTCGRTYAPPRDFCTVDALALDESHDVALPDRGVITNYTVVTPVQYPGQRETEPFGRASVLLDDVDAMLNLQALVDIAPADLRPGIRVEAVWIPEAERDVGALTNRGWGAVDGAIAGWRPTGEPDEPADRHLGRVF